jgi:hypothetical protein
MIILALLSKNKCLSHIVGWVSFVLYVSLAIVNLKINVMMCLKYLKLL